MPAWVGYYHWLSMLLHARSLKRRFIAATLALAAMTIMGKTATAAAPTIEVGEPFPSLTLPRADGKELFSISKYRGERVLLHVFASW